MDYTKKPTVIIVGKKKSNVPEVKHLTSTEAKHYREDVKHFLAEQSSRYRFNADGTCSHRI